MQTKPKFILHFAKGDTHVWGILYFVTPAIEVTSTFSHWRRFSLPTDSRRMLSSAYSLCLDEKPDVRHLLPVRYCSSSPCLRTLSLVASLLYRRNLAQI